MKKHLKLILLPFALSACSTQPTLIGDSAPSAPPTNIHRIADAVPKYEPKSRGGNPKSYQVFGKTYYVLPTNEGFTEQGTASWYGTKFHGRKTSNGETYDMYAMTAAHKNLPLPSYLEVTNISNGKQVIVRVNDRGPFHGGRIIDLSYAAAAKLGMLKQGTSSVKIRAITPEQNNSHTPAPPLLSSTSTVDSKTTNLKETNLYIQVGAFGNEENAKQVKQELENSHIQPIHIHIDKNNESTFYRVQVGPYINLVDADLMRIKLSQLGVKKIHYMQR